MKRTRTYFPLVALFAGLSLPGSVSAQQGDSGLDKRREAGPSNAGVRRQVAQLAKLHKAMKRKLDLSRKQDEAVDRLFHTQLRNLKNRQGRGRRFGANAGEMKELNALREELKEALRAGDEAAARELRQQFRRKLRASSPPVAVTLDGFFATVAAELDESQRPEFHKLIKRLGAGGVRQNRRGNLRKLRRTVMNPDVGLSNEQQEAVRAILRDGLLAVAQAERGGTRETDGITAKVRADVLHTLTPRQRAKVEAALNADRSRGRGKRPASATEDSPRSHGPDVADDDGDPIPREVQEQKDEPDGQP